MYKQPGTGAQVPDVSVGFVVVWLGSLLETARVGTLVPEEAEAPVAVLPGPLGYCLCVSRAMDRWLSRMTPE